MFENFSFDTPRSPSVDSDNTIASLDVSRSVSPCSSIALADYSITDLAADFGRQRLRQTSYIYTQSCQTYANLDDEAGWSVEPETIHTRSESVRSSSPTRKRVERQANARLLCSTSHHRDIASLVMNMINQQEQCFVCPPTSIPQAQALQADTEEEDDMAELTPLSRQSSGLSISRYRDHRRHSDLRKPGSSVCKEVRLRKDRPRRQKSNDKSTI